MATMAGKEVAREANAGGSVAGDGAMQVASVLRDYTTISPAQQEAEIPRTVRQYAHECTGLGLKVHPLYSTAGAVCACYKGAACETPGKHPILIGWQDKATDKNPQIELWWKQYPGANLGIHVGRASGVAVFDVDPRHNGDDALYELEQQLGRLPETRRVKTGGGGEHVYMKHPGGLLLSCTLAPGLELKADSPPKPEHNGKPHGANLVGVGSLHASGQRYAWEVSTVDLPFAPLPAAWLAYLREAAEDGQEGDFKAAKPFEGKYPDGRRYGALLSLLGTLRKRGLDVDELAEMGLIFGEHRFLTPSTEAQVQRMVADVCRRYPAGEVLAPQLADNTVWSHSRLMASDFAAPAFVVADLVAADGLTMLGGRKKLGKSRLCLQLAIAVASGAPFLGRPTLQGPVLYLCLEDGLARIKHRLGQAGAPADLSITYLPAFRPLDEGGLTDLADWLDRLAPRLCIIDTLTAARSGRVRENESGDIADILNGLRRLAQDARTALLLAHHHGKHSYGDAGDDLRGSSAIAGASDINLGFYKSEAGYTLLSEGRDIEGAELRLEFDMVAWAWRLVGDARQLARSEADGDARAALRTLTEADASTVGREMGKSRIAAQTALRRLVADGQATKRTAKDKKGSRVMYSLAGGGDSE